MAVRKRFLQQYMQEENTTVPAPDSLNNGSERSDSDSDGENASARNRKGEKLYCLCKKPYDEREFMIGCDGCGNWFHGKCVSVTPSMASSYPKWFCSKCKAEQAGFTQANPPVGSAIAASASFSSPSTSSSFSSSASANAAAQRRRKSAPVRSIKNMPRPSSSPPLASANGSAFPAPSPVSSATGDSKDHFLLHRLHHKAEDGPASAPSSSLFSPASPAAPAAVKTEPATPPAASSASSTSSTSTSAASAFPDATAHSVTTVSSIPKHDLSANGLRLPKKKYLASSADAVAQSISKPVREASAKSDTEPALMEVSSPSQNEDKPHEPVIVAEPKKRGRKRKNPLPPQPTETKPAVEDSSKPTTRSGKDKPSKEEEEEEEEEKKPAPTSSGKESERDRRARERDKQRGVDRQRSKEDVDEASQESAQEDKKPAEKESKSPKRGKKRKESESKLPEEKKEAKPSPSPSPRRQAKKEKEAKETKEPKEDKEEKEQKDDGAKKSPREKKEEKAKENPDDTSKDSKSETKVEERKGKKGPRAGKRRKSTPLSDSFLVENGEIAPRRAKLAAYFPEDYQKPLVPEKKPPPESDSSSSEESSEEGEESGSSSSSAEESASQDGPKDTRPVYCVCKRPYDNRAFMIQCTRCKDWFHGTCIGVSWQEAKKIKAKTQKFNCPNCSPNSKKGSDSKK